MRIKPRGQNSEARERVSRDVSRIRRDGPRRDPVCIDSCPDYDLAVGCRRDCAKAPARLSSDPDRFPVEPKIAPLVYEIKKLGVFHPCWSCEGHNGPSGELWKMPRVWFYADSVVHLRALADAVNEMSVQGLLSTRWQVVVTFSDEGNADTAFSLEPGVDAHAVGLDRLQSDIGVISEKLEAEFALACDKLDAGAR
jgi:hypothetical protein